ncbi:MAG: MFS transporter [Sulfurovum sp. AS07-7]|nr:MAG: MFS transporter [Sulfurovum sp. AS07-7]
MFKQIFPLSTIIGLRFFGLFIVLPVLSVYALELKGGTPFLAGIVVGGYALTQALFQVPFGAMSDKFGRKKTLLIGTVVFIIGSIICALSDSIYMLMIGRFIQGAGAVGAVVSAMISDLVKEEQRAHAMAIMGGTIALSFAVAMVLAPLIGGNYGIDKLFWLTAILGILSIFILFTKVPNPPSIIHTYSEAESKFKDVFSDKALNSMYITFLFHSSVMTMAFFIIPLVMTADAVHGGFGWSKAELWKVYLPAMLFGIVSMGPAAIFGEKYGKGKQVFMISITSIMLAFFAMGFSNTPLVFVIGVVLFFIGFNMFEPLLQSFVSKFARVHQKGAALGVANTFAYIGIFLGGIIAGYIIHHYDRATLAIFVVMLCIFWFLWILKMNNPNARANVYLPLDNYKRDDIMKLQEHEAIVEVYINETEHLAIVKYEKEMIDEKGVKELLK